MVPGFETGFYAAYIIGAMSAWNVGPLNRVGLEMGRSRFLLVIQLIIMASLLQGLVSLSFPMSLPGAVFQLAFWAFTGMAFGISVYARSRDSGLGLRWTIATILCPVLALPLMFRKGSFRIWPAPGGGNIRQGIAIGGSLIALSTSIAIGEKMVTAEIVNGFARQIAEAGGDAEAIGSRLILAADVVDGGAVASQEWRRREAHELCAHPQMVALMEYGGEIQILIRDAGEVVTDILVNQVTCSDFSA